MGKDTFPGVAGIPRPSDGRIKDALDAIDYLMDRGGFSDLTKEQMAVALDWYDQFERTKPNRRRVEQVCNLTRDQHNWEYVSEILGGMVVAYSPSDGGMTLIQPDGERPLTHMLHVLRGDLHKAQSCMTMNRRREATWYACGCKCVAQGDADLAKLFFQAQGEIHANGFVSETTSRDLFVGLRTRGLLENEK